MKPCNPVTLQLKDALFSGELLTHRLMNNYPSTSVTYRDLGLQGYAVS